MDLAGLRLGEMICKKTMAIFQTADGTRICSHSKKKMKENEIHSVDLGNISPGVSGLLWLTQEKAEMQVVGYSGRLPLLVRCRLGWQWAVTWVQVWEVCSAQLMVYVAKTEVTITSDKHIHCQRTAFETGSRLKYDDICSVCYDLKTTHGGLWDPRQAGVSSCAVFVHQLLVHTH